MSSDYNSMKKKHTLFTWSTPVGYSFKEVDSVIEEYKQAISDAAELIAKKNAMIERLKKENATLTNNLVDATQQFQELAISDRPVEDSLTILSDFMQGEEPAVQEPARQQQVNNIPYQAQQQSPPRYPQNIPKQYPQRRTNNGSRQSPNGGYNIVT